MHSSSASLESNVGDLDEAMVLGEAVVNAGAKLGFSATRVGEIIGRDRSSITRKGVNPNSKEGELAMMLIRVFRSLYALVGGDEENMLHFMRHQNHGTGGVPAEQLKTIGGLVAVLQYLDAMRGR